MACAQTLSSGPRKEDSCIAGGLWVGSVSVLLPAKCKLPVLERERGHQFLPLQPCRALTVRIPKAAWSQTVNWGDRVPSY